MKILITGATGFIGFHLTRKLLQGNNKVFAVVRTTTDRSKINKKIKTFIFNNNLPELVSFMRKEKFDGVIHLASLFLSSHNSEQAAELVKSNVLFSTLLLEASVRSNTPWFINTGTYYQHYQSKKYSPVNLYSATKQAFEDIAKYYLETFDINFVSVRLFDTFGPGDTRPKLFSLWSKIAQTGERLAMSPGRQIVDINYVENVADGFIRLARLLSSKRGKKLKGKIFSISSGNRMDLKQLAKIFEEASGKKLNIDWGQRPYREREVMRPWSGENVPGWKPKISLRRGIKYMLGHQAK